MCRWLIPPIFRETSILTLDNWCQTSSEPSNRMRIMLLSDALRWLSFTVIGFDTLRRPSRILLLRTFLSSSIRSWICVDRMENGRESKPKGSDVIEVPHHGTVQGYASSTDNSQCMIVIARLGYAVSTVP
jgi:hypothetical protein